MRYHFTDSEIKTLAAAFTVLCDTREQENGHITAWLKRADIPFKRRSLATDYHGPGLPEDGLLRHLL